jgi:hypothetical protein
MNDTFEDFVVQATNAEYSMTKLGQPRHITYTLDGETIYVEPLETITGDYSDRELMYYDAVFMYCRKELLAKMLNLQPLSCEEFVKRIRDKKNNKLLVKIGN